MITRDYMGVDETINWHLKFVKHANLHTWASTTWHMCSILPLNK